MRICINEERGVSIDKISARKENEMVLIMVFCHLQFLNLVIGMKLDIPILCPTVNYFSSLSLDI